MTSYKIRRKSDVRVYFLQELGRILWSTCSISNWKASGLRKPLPQIWESQILLFEELLSASSYIPYRSLKRDFKNPEKSEWKRIVVEWHFSEVLLTNENKENKHVILCFVLGIILHCLSTSYIYLITVFHA